MSQPPQAPPPPPPAGPPGPPGPPGQPPGGTLVLDLQGSVLTSNVITPTVRINGYPVPASYGTNSYPLAPGRWHVDVSAQWLRTYGQAATDVEVGPGQIAQLFYAAPWHQFTTGSIGTVKQKRKGALPFLLLLAVLVAVVVLVAVAAALGS